MTSTPIPLRQVLKPDELLRCDLDPEPAALGSFWVESNRDLQSRIAKFFKHPSPPCDQNPAVRALTQAYADLIVRKTTSFAPAGIVRMLASRETKPDASTPLSHLALTIAEKLRIAVYEPFYRTESRKSMRDNPRLSGPDALKRRIEYVIQDLCIRPQALPSRILLLDDIYNLGASARVYSEALKRLCGVSEVLSINLAATRFYGGKDGWGRLALEIEWLLDSMRSYLPAEYKYLVGTVVVTGTVLHQAGCVAVTDGIIVPRFLTPADCEECPHCLKKKQSWWQRFLRGM